MKLYCKFYLEVTIEVPVENRGPGRSEGPSEATHQVRSNSGPRNWLYLWVQSLRLFTYESNNIPEFQPHFYIYSSSIFDLIIKILDKNLPYQVVSACPAFSAFQLSCYQPLRLFPFSPPFAWLSKASSQVPSLSWAITQHCFLYFGGFL